MQQFTITYHIPILIGKMYILNNKVYYRGNFEELSKIISSIEQQSAETSPWKCRNATKSQQNIKDIKK